MALSNEEVAKARTELDESQNPFFFFDDDQDGLCSFLQLYKYKTEGKGYIVKTVPKITAEFLQRIPVGHDKIFILDLAEVEQEFIDGANLPVIWIDHHGPYKRQNVKYFNPRVSNFADNFPTSYLAYQIAQKDMWLCMVGCIADWFVPEFIDDFRKEYPDLIGADLTKAGDIIYNSRLGELVKMISFILKGKSSDVTKCIKIMTRIEDPYEILDQTTDRGKFLFKRYKEVNKHFEPLIEQVRENANNAKDKIVVFKYKETAISFTSDLSNEAIYRHPDKIVFICREKDDEYKCSIRSAKTNLKPIVEKSIQGLDGYGGGHEMACGLNIKKHHFDEFMDRFRKELN